MQIAINDRSDASQPLFRLRDAKRLSIRTITRVRGLVGNE